MKLIRTLVVDDSAFVRKAIGQMLARSPFIEVVGMARDGNEALEVANELRPDVITCDLEMPGLDGVGFVRKQMERSPIPIVILTASPKDAARVLEALEAGAVDFVQKPSALATEDVFRIRDELVEKVKAAALAPASHLIPAAETKITKTAIFKAATVDVLVLGISTGGPQALRYLLPQLQADFPVPVGIVLHMPVGYTALFAEKLNELCNLRVVEASNGNLVQPGTAFLAPAGHHLLFRRNLQGQVVTQLTLLPNDKPHRPSVDILFQSAAETYRNRVLAVVMTGMGDDGKQGAAWVKAQGGTVITESEESCVIYGMPRSVVEAGLSDGSFSLKSMAEAIMKHL